MDRYIARGISQADAAKDLVLVAPYRAELKSLWFIDSDSGREMGSFSCMTLDGHNLRFARMPLVYAPVFCGPLADGGEPRRSKCGLCWVF